MTIINGIFSKPSSGRVSAKELIYFEIKEKILKGELEPGQHLVEDSLSSELGISRTPLRSALQSLEHDNLVERQPNGRLKVAPVSIQEAKEIFIVRSKLEGLAVEQATENATEADIEALTDIANMIQQVHKTGSLEDVLFYGDKFHTYINKLSQNRTVINIISQLNLHIHRYLRLLPNDKSVRSIDDHEEHELIIKYMAKGDKEGARLATERHIENSLEAAIESIKKSNVL